MVVSVWLFVLGQRDHDVVAGPTSPSSDRHDLHRGLCRRHQEPVPRRPDAASVVPRSRMDFEVCTDRLRQPAGSSPSAMLVVLFRPASVRGTRRSHCSLHQNSITVSTRVLTSGCSEAGTKETAVKCTCTFIPQRKCDPPYFAEIHFKKV